MSRLPLSNTDDTTEINRVVAGSKPDKTPASGDSSSGGGGSPTGPAGGDLGGTYPNPTVVQIQGTPVDPTTPSTGDSMVFDGTNWSPQPGPSVPIGGAKYARLAKNSGTNYDAGWYGPYIINVKDYGATGDGATNDTAAITAAIGAMTNYSTLYFPAGLYITDTQTISGLTGICIMGDGRTASRLKSRTGSRVWVISGSYVTYIGLGVDGGCTVRTAGQQAVNLDGDHISIAHFLIENSGEFALSIGYNAATSNVQIAHGFIGETFADGVNLHSVSQFSISDVTVDGADDDLIAAYASTAGVISGCFLRARTDLATTTGRGLALFGCTDIEVSGLNIDTVKQSGIFLNDESSSGRPTRISFSGVRVSNAAVNSGHGVLLQSTTDVTFDGLTVENLAGGNCIELVDWQRLTIKNFQLTQANDIFCRGIHCDESSTLNTPWDRLNIKDGVIRMIGASTNSCIYLVPSASTVISNLIIDNVTGDQVSGGDYITTNHLGTAAFILNNTSLTGNSITNGGSGITPTTANNN